MFAVGFVIGGALGALAIAVVSAGGRRDASVTAERLPARSNGPSTSH